MNLIYFKFTWFRVTINFSILDHNHLLFDFRRIQQSKQCLYRFIWDIIAEKNQKQQQQLINLCIFLLNGFLKLQCLAGLVFGYFIESESFFHFERWNWEEKKKTIWWSLTILLLKRIKNRTKKIDQLEQHDWVELNWVAFCCIILQHMCAYELGDGQSKVHMRMSTSCKQKLSSRAGS